MHKLPVFATAREVFAFLFREAGPILRLSWFPLLVVTIISFFALRAGLDTFREVFATSGKASPPDIGFSFWDVLNNVATIVGTAIVAVALHRVILFDDRQPGTFVNLNIGKVEGLFMLLPVVFFAAVILLAALLGIAFAGLPAAVIGLLVFIVFAAAIFLAVRFSLVFPIAVIERRYNFNAAWTLTRENFWRVVGLWLVVLIPPGLFFLVLQALLLPRLNFNPGSEAGMATVIDQFETLLLRTLVLSYPASIIFGALGVGVLSYSYKALTGLRPDEVVRSGG